MSRNVVHGPRVRLEPFDERFLTQSYVDWLNDPDLMRYSEQRHRRHSLESNAAYAQSFDHQTRFLWAIVDTRDDTHAGNVNAYFDPRNLVADVGLLIGEASKRGQGLGLEAWVGALHALFLSEGARKVTAGCAALNQGMLRIMRASNMHADGVRSKQLLIDGAGVDVIHMAMFSDSFCQDERYAVSPAAN